MSTGMPTEVKISQIPNQLEELQMSIEVLFKELDFLEAKLQRVMVSFPKEEVNKTPSTRETMSEIAENLYSKTLQIKRAIDIVSKINSHLEL